jgi:hypothetical protein
LNLRFSLVVDAFSLDPRSAFAKPCRVESAGPFARTQLAFNHGRYEEARDALLQLLHDNPRDPAVLRSLSLVSTRLDQPAQAFRYAQQAVTAAPQDSEAHFSLALLYLLHGNYEKGFIEYEWRLLRANCVAPRYAQGELWDGRPLRSEALMLHCEQGFGDNLQFIRFLPQLRERVEKIHLACHPELVRLFSGLEGLAGIVTDKQPLPPCEFHCPLLSLPRILKVTLPTLPHDVPYLPFDPPAPAPTASLRPRIGLVWRTNRASPNWQQRSIPLADLQSLADLPCDWISLQRDVDADEQALLRTVFRAEERGPAFRDFKDTADALQTLDLLITVDTSIAHVAGATGRPAWILLPRWADWRWLLDRPDSPWYPSLTLLRQKTDGDWTSVAQTLREKLAQSILGAENVRPF